MRKYLIIPAVALAISATAGCRRQQAGETVAAEPRPAATVPPAVAPQLAAAEPFETLTATAFTASPAELQAGTLAAEAAAKAVRGGLPPAAAGELAARVAEVRTALQKDNRADIAIASAEAYRTLVSAAPPAKVPLGVNLLDYAGFRYQADLGAKPVRWADMATAAAFARAQWDALSPRVTDAALRSRVDQAVEALRIAEAQRNPVQADQAARAELDLVDELEAHFNGGPPPP